MRLPPKPVISPPVGGRGEELDGDGDGGVCVTSS